MELMIKNRLVPPIAGVQETFNKLIKVTLDSNLD